MDREKLKLMVRNLELLLDGIKAEVYSDPEAYKTPARFDPEVMKNYDEVFDDEYGYSD